MPHLLYLYFSLLCHKVVLLCECWIYCFKLLVNKEYLKDKLKEQQHLLTYRA